MKTLLCAAGLILLASFTNAPVSSVTSKAAPARVKIANSKVNFSPFKKMLKATDDFSFEIENFSSYPWLSDQFWISIYSETDHTPYFADYLPTGDLQYMTIPSGIYDISISNTSGTSQTVSIYIHNSSMTVIGSNSGTDSTVVSGVALGPSDGTYMEIY